MGGLQKSNKLLNDARAAITEYEQTVKIIENQLADSDKHKPKPFAADALKLTEQVTSFIPRKFYHIDVFLQRMRRTSS